MRNIIEAGLDALANGRNFDLDITHAVYAHARASNLTNGPHLTGEPDKTVHRRDR